VFSFGCFGFSCLTFEWCCPKLCFFEWMFL
jgi:hypothetical protein